MWGGLTAAAWQYIGRQGALQGTYELLRAVNRVHFGDADPRGRWMLTAGLGGMGSSQPISAKMAGFSSLTVEIDPAKITRLDAAGGADLTTDDLDEALAALARGTAEGVPVAVLLRGSRDRVPRARPAVRRRRAAPRLPRPARCRHRPDRGPRRPLRLCPGGVHPGGLGDGPRGPPRRGGGRGAGLHRRSGDGDADVRRAGLGGVRERQQPARPGVGAPRRGRRRE
jgi:hypothetical protein